MASATPDLGIPSHAIITFRVRRIAEAKCILAMAVCLSVPRRIPTLLHGPGCNFVWGAPLVVHYWADLQSVYGCFVAMTT